MGSSGSVAWSIGKPPDAEFSIGQAPSEWSVGTSTSPPLQEGPATPPPKNSGVEGGGQVSTGDWLLDALTGPSTLAGRLLKGSDKSPSIEEKAQEHMTGLPRAGNYPILDFSTGVQEPHLKGALEGLSGFTSPNQIPLLGVPGSRALSAGFAALTIPQIMEQYEGMKALEAKGDQAGASAKKGEMAATFLMGALASYHAGSVGEPLPKGVTLTHDEASYLTGMIQQHLESSASNGDHAGVEDAVHGMAAVLPQTQKVLYQSMLEETIENDKRDLLRTTDPAERSRITAHMNDFQDLLEQHNEPSTKQAQKDIPLSQREPPSGSVHPSSPEVINPAEAQSTGEENLRDDSRATRGEGDVGAVAGNGTEQEGDGGDSTERKLAALSTLVPDFQRVVGGGSETSGEGVTDAQSTTSRNGEEPPPVISKEIDRDLKNGGINVVRGGEDIGLIARYLGSLSQAANRLGNPIFKMVADRIVDTSLAIARNTRDSLVGFRKEVRNNITQQDWEQVVRLLDDPSVSKGSLPPNTDTKITQAYEYTRDLLDRHREQARDAKRLEMVAGGMSLTKAKQIIPDDWGIQEGYYVHAFPGNWTITEHVGLDAKGNPIFEPIDTGWRATTLSEAQAKAREYLASNPQANLKVQLDNVTLPGRGITDRNRLRTLYEEIKSSSMMIHNGANPDGVMADLKETSDKLNFGPRRPAPKTYGPTLERESNLPGYVRDLDNFERYIAGMERYIQLAPARAEIMKFRNSLAQQGNMPEALKIGEFPKRYSGDHANMLGRLDASIEALEGYPTGFDSAIRNQLQKFGYDPNLVNTIYSHINSIEALLKLGFNPASAGLHLAQTIVATYPVIGEKWTGYGIANAYSSKYDALVHDLGIEATTNLLDVDTYKAYRAGYVNSVTQSSGIGEALKGLASTGYHDLQASGLYMFSKGVETARRVATIGAYEKALSEGKTPQEARDYARDTLIRTQFLYNPVDTPIAMRAMPRSMTQFKNFTVKMMEFMYGLRGAEIPRFILGLGAIGYAGTPFLTGLSNLTKWLSGYDPEAELKKAFPRASRGILGMLGIDYTHNIGFSDWLGGHALDPKNLGGPGISDVSNLIKALGAEVKGPSREGQQDIDTAFRNISPEARRLWDEGVRLSSQPKLIDPRTGSSILNNLSTKERIELAAGLTPIRVAEERDTHEYIRNQIEQTKDKRGFFVDRMAELALDLSRPDLSNDARVETFRQLISLSHSAQDYGVAYNLSKAVTERAKEMQMERLTRDVRKAPKVDRYPAYQEMQRFKQENQE